MCMDNQRKLDTRSTYNTEQCRCVALKGRRHRMCVATIKFLRPFEFKSKSSNGRSRLLEFLGVEKYTYHLSQLVYRDGASSTVVHGVQATLFDNTTMASLEQSNKKRKDSEGSAVIDSTAASDNGELSLWKKSLDDLNGSDPKVVERAFCNISGRTFTDAMNDDDFSIQTWETNGVPAVFVITKPANGYSKTCCLMAIVSAMKNHPDNPNVQVSALYAIQSYKLLTKENDNHRRP